MTNIPSPSPTGRRYLFIALPCLATDRIRRQKLGRSWRSRRPATPLATVTKIKGALRLAALDENAGGLGLCPGQALADARAMIPALETVEEDSGADQALLESLAAWAERYTPIVAIAPGNAGRGLVLDITGVTHLFGGERRLAEEIPARLHAQGLLAGCAIADTPGAASAEARFGASSIIPIGNIDETLRPLPIAALRLDPGTVAALDRVGLKRIGQIIDAPRAPLAARFGGDLLRRLDQALGREEEALNPHRPPPTLSAERRFAEPVARQEDIAATLSSLADTLARGLEKRGEGARALELSLFRVDGFVARLSVSTSRPVRQPKLVLDLFREKFAGLGEEVDAGFGFDLIRLALVESAPHEDRQADLAGHLAGASDLDALVDRIGVRLGPGSIGRMEARDSHVPECAQTFVAAGYTRRMDAAAPLAVPAISAVPVDRPLRLFGRPEPIEAIGEVPDGPPVHFRWRRVLYRIARSEGPERISSEWWRGADFTRDYFRVEDGAGRRFWLFREGVYEAGAPAPRWYLHGLFA